MPDHFVHRFTVQEVDERNIPELMGMLSQLDELVPGWCHDVFVRLAPDMPVEVAAEVTCRYDYRRATIFLGFKFFHEKEFQWARLIHEICHIIQEPLWNSITDMKDRLVELEPNTKKMVEEMLRHAREQSTCDMAKSVMKSLSHFNGPPFTGQ